MKPVILTSGLVFSIGIMTYPVFWLDVLSAIVCILLTAFFVAILYAGWKVITI